MQHALAIPLFIRALRKRKFSDPIDRVEHFGTKRVRYQCVAITVPKKGIGNVALGRRGELNKVTAHRAFSRALA